MSRLESLLADMVAIDTTNPSLVAGAPGEAALVGYLARRLQAAGLEVDLWDVLPGRPNIVARLRGSGSPAGRPAAPFAHARGHLDVVAAPGPEYFAPQVRDGRMYGRGAADMKAGFAAAVLAAEALAAARRAAARRPPGGRAHRRGVAERRRGGAAGALPPGRRRAARVHRPRRGHGARRLRLVRGREPRRRGGRRRHRARRRRHRPAGAGAGRHRAGSTPSWRAGRRPPTAAAASTPRSSPAATSTRSTRRSAPWASSAA